MAAILRMLLTILNPIADCNCVCNCYMQADGEQTSKKSSQKHRKEPRRGSGSSSESRMGLLCGQCLRHVQDYRFDKEEAFSIASPYPSRISFASLGSGRQSPEVYGRRRTVALQDTSFDLNAIEWPSLGSEKGHGKIDKGNERSGLESNGSHGLGNEPRKNSNRN